MEKYNLAEILRRNINFGELKRISLSKMLSIMFLKIYFPGKQNLVK